jgi:hypothetical protein
MAGRHAPTEAPAQSAGRREVHGIAPVSTSKDEFSYEICDNGGPFLGCPVAASFDDATVCLWSHGLRGGQRQFTETCGAAIGAHGDGERIPCVPCHLLSGREELLIDGQSCAQPPDLSDCRGVLIQIGIGDC